MANARTSAGPAGRPGACISQIPARSGTELPYLAISDLEIVHWSILLRGIEGHGEDLDENGCFTSRTCVLRLDRYGSSGYFFFEKHSLIDFQIGKGRKREFRAAELGDDATENDNFQSGKQRLQGSKIFPGAFISYS